MTPAVRARTVARRRRGPGPQADQRWLLTYADMITLLLVLFIVLFSISVVNTSKFELLKRTLASSFSNGILETGSSVLPEAKVIDPTPITDTPPSFTPEIHPAAPISFPDASPEQALETGQLDAVKKRVDDAATTAGIRRQIQTTVNERGLAIRLLTDGLLFDPGSWTLRPEAGRLLAPIATAVRDLRNPIRVEGGTDSDPIHRGLIRSNWELGVLRSTAVVRFLEGTGVPGARMIAASSGQYRPIDSNDTAEGKARNRRVEILLLRLQGAPKQAPASALGG